MALRGDATFFEVFANHPDLYRWYVGSFYGEVFRGGKVAQPYKELLRLRAFNAARLPLLQSGQSSRRTGSWAY